MKSWNNNIEHVVVNISLILCVIAIASGELYILHIFVDMFKINPIKQTKEKYNMNS